MPFNQTEKIGRRITGQRGLHKMRTARSEVIGRGRPRICKIATSTTRDQNFSTGPRSMLEQFHTQTSRSCGPSAKKTGRPASNYKYLRIVHSRALEIACRIRLIEAVLTRLWRTGNHTRFQATTFLRKNLNCKLRLRGLPVRFKVIPLNQ